MIGSPVVPEKPLPGNPYESPLESGAIAATAGRFFTWKRVAFWATSLLLMASLAVLLLPVTRTGPNSARQAICLSQLKQISDAIRHYSAVHGQPPPRFTVDEVGRPLHSWRTLILPYLEQHALYAKIDLTKPWDDPIHDQVRQTMLPEYACPSLNLQLGQTNYLANPSGWPSALRWANAGFVSEDLLASELRSDDVLVFEVDTSRTVPWMAPTDGDYNLFLANPREGMLPHGRLFNLILADGHVVTAKLIWTTDLDPNPTP